MSHALDERLQPLWSRTDMGIIALPLGTTSAFCSRGPPITACFRRNPSHPAAMLRGAAALFCRSFVGCAAEEKVISPQSDGDICWMICHSEETLIC